MNASSGEGRFILVLNCGSSSVKAALFATDTDPPRRQPDWRGRVEGIGSPDAQISVQEASPRSLAKESGDAYHAALTELRAGIADWLGERTIVAVAHRVVHGGSRHSAPALIDAGVLADLRAIISLAPLHQPFALEVIDTLLAAEPGIPHIACFDTAFHHTLPLVEKMLPLPSAQWEQGLRRYGFHGLSYEYLALALGERYGSAARGRSIVAHLGSGASLCAMRDGVSVATTMGFSALDGLMMGTRSGALDPGAVLYLMQTESLSADQVAHLLYHQCGLLGVSGVSSDPRVLLSREGEPNVAQALALYVRSIVREIGALVATLGGLDMLAFSAGIGEHNAAIRERVCGHLAFLGVVLDPIANAAGAPVISIDASRVRVVVEPTNEEWILARAAADRLGAGASAG